MHQSSVPCALSRSDYLVSEALLGWGPVLNRAFSTRNLLVQLKRYLLEEDDRNRTLLQLAALSGSRNALDAVWDACRELGIKATEVNRRGKLYGTSIGLVGTGHRSTI